MIKKIDNTNPNVVEQIHKVFQASYAVEAQLLNATNFPPLQRGLDYFMQSDNVFIGYFKNGKLAGVVEVYAPDLATHIQSLVVHPEFFKQGIASTLLENVLDTYDANKVTVETGVANEPATRLYKKFGFIEVRQWDTDHGVRKIRFEKIRGPF